MFGGLSLSAFPANGCLVPGSGQKRLLLGPGCRRCHREELCKIREIKSATLRYQGQTGAQPGWSTKHRYHVEISGYRDRERVSGMEAVCSHQANANRNKRPVETANPSLFDSWKEREHTGRLGKPLTKHQISPQRRLSRTRNSDEFKSANRMAEISFSGWRIVPMRQVNTACRGERP